MNKEELTKEQKTFFEMLNHSDFKELNPDIDRLLKWNDDIEKAEEVVAGHSLRVAYLAKLLGEKAALKEKKLKNLYFAALFHDIGKHLIPSEIIGKRGKLTDEEFEIIKKHSSLAEDLLKGILDDDVIEIIRQHHERINKTGYPRGIEPFKEAKILGIIDSYDAMTANRVYNHTMTKEEALRELELCTIPRKDNGKGELYDPVLVNLFKNIINEEPSI